VTERGLLFETIAEDYDRVRPGYPAELVDLACAGLGPRSRVLEVGCGTGKLTRDLAQRGFAIDAVDPGEGMVVVARRAAPEATFHIGRFEDIEPPGGAFDAVFSATAFDWVDPQVGWAKVARLLRPGGTFGLFGHTVDTTGPLHDAFRQVWRDVRPDARRWEPRTMDEQFAGAEARRDNVSEVWAWLTQHDLAVPEAAALFTDVRIETRSREITETADEVMEHVRTTSSYLELDEARRERLEQRHREIIDAAGGYRETIHAMLVTARAVPAGP
jgi:ubiquinone/menaquinone biosynthesis C-methylase UbiE